MEHNKSTGKKAKTLDELKFRRLGTYFYGTNRLWWDSVMWDTVVCQWYDTTGEIKQMGKHNTPENGRGAWVALWAHPTHTDKLHQSESTCLSSH
jgi:hypothetical protein